MEEGGQKNGREKGQRHICLEHTIVLGHNLTVPFRTYIGRPCEPDARHHLDRQLGLLALSHARVPLEQGRAHEALCVVLALLAWPATAHNLVARGKCKGLVVRKEETFPLLFNILGWQELGPWGGKEALESHCIGLGSSALCRRIPSRATGRDRLPPPGKRAGGRQWRRQRRRPDPPVPCVVARLQA